MKELGSRLNGEQKSKAMAGGRLYEQGQALDL